MAKRKICVVVANRANYSSIKSAMRAIDAHPDLELQVIAGASVLLDRYGSAIDLIRKDGFAPDATFHMIIEGETPSTMAKSAGLGLLELPTLLEGLQPDIVLTVGDRFEIISIAVAAAFMNIPLAHTMGGEVTGTIDESVRHAVTKLAHIHFPANAESGERIIKMGEDPATVHVVGCPRIDLIQETLEGSTELGEDIFATFKGVGDTFELDSDFLLVSQHPVTTEYGQARRQIEETLHALDELQKHTIMIWPNVDAGSEDIAKGIRTFREHNECKYLHMFKNLPIDVYVKLMSKCACVIGNSSSAIREGAYIGVPAVNVGTRQNARQRGRNVIDVGHDKDEIAGAVRRQIDHGKYASENIYGDGKAGERIADILASCQAKVQKQIVY